MKFNDPRDLGRMIYFRMQAGGVCSPERQFAVLTRQYPEYAAWKEEAVAFYYTYSGAEQPKPKPAPNH